jgi:hypothetical protein
MDKKLIKESILSSISEELDKWLEKESTITNGYDYETEFAKTAGKVAQVMLQKSLGDLPKSRNGKKNSKLALARLKYLRNMYWDN